MNWIKKINLKFINPGFTLLEIMIGFAIIGIGLLVIMGMQITAIKANSFGYEMTAAVTESQNILEQMMKLSLSDFCLNDTDGIIDSPGSPVNLDSTSCPCIDDLDAMGIPLPCVSFSIIGNTDIHGVSLNIPMYIVEDRSTQPGTKTITTLINWTDKNGKVRQVSMIRTKSM